MTRRAVSRPCCAGRSAVTVAVTPRQMADWLVRTAVPDLSAMAGFADRGDWFRALPTYNGHTRTGQVRGWSGALTRADDLRDELHQVWWRGVKAVQDAGGRVDRAVALEHSDVIVAAKRELAPSHLGPAAHQVIAGAIDLVLIAGQLSSDDGEAADLVRRTWHTSLHALADRALVRELAAPEQP